MGGTDLGIDCGDTGWGESHRKDREEKVIIPGSGQVTRQSTVRAWSPDGELSQ